MAARFMSGETSVKDARHYRLLGGGEQGASFHAPASEPVSFAPASHRIHSGGVVVRGRQVPLFETPGSWSPSRETWGIATASAMQRNDFALTGRANISATDSPGVARGLIISAFQAVSHHPPRRSRGISGRRSPLSR